MKEQIAEAIACAETEKDLYNIRLLIVQYRNQTHDVESVAKLYALLASRSRKLVNTKRLTTNF